MKDCFFCKIVQGEIPNHTIYEDKENLAFLDLSQIVDGHTLLVPKKHVRWVWGVEDPGNFYATAQTIAKHFQKVTGKEFVMSVTIGELVAHAHLHLLPQTEGAMGKVMAAWDEARNAREVSDERMAEIADRFRIE